MKKYEVAVVLHPDLEIDMGAPLKRLDELFARLDANIVRRDEWGKRKLAYPINGQTFGVYVFYLVELDTGHIDELERNLELNEEVIRHLVVVYDLPEDSRGSESNDEGKASEPEAPEES